MLNQYQQDKVRAEAARIYERSQAGAEQYRKMGMTLPTVMTMSLEEIEAHLTLCKELECEHHVTVDGGRWIGESRERIVQFAEARAAQERRRAGVKALKSKYGHNLAQKIVREKSGRPITLR